MGQFDHIFKPLKIGNKEVRNRIFMPPISTNLGDKGYVTDELVEHYRKRAEGGVALFVTEVVTVEPTYVYLPGDMSIHDDSFIKGWKKLVNAVHEYGSLILPQLFHPAYMAFPIPGTPRLIAPSNVGPYYAKEAPRAVTVEELKVIIKQFADAALRIKKAGGDGVEIHAAHAHGLLGGFLSPLYNKRTDEYGGDLESRLRLTLEVIQAVRQACGKDFIIDVRLSGDEYTDGGLNLNDMIYVAKRLEENGVDMLHISGGTTIARGSSIAAGGTRMGTHSHLAKEIKKHVNIVVTTVGRILEPWLCEELIANEVCDAVMVGRANLCDAEFVNKIKNGRINEIRPCISCLRCLNGIMFGKRISCSVNPSFELENEDTIKLAEKRKNILIIGSGPAGLEAAYLLSKRGHRVVLAEKDEKLGGALNIACVPIAKQELCRLTKYLINRIKDKVEILTNFEVDDNYLEANKDNFDEVIIASGANPIIINSFNNFKQVMTADEVLAGKKFPGRKIVIVGGGSVGCETADYLAPLINDMFPRNRDITVIEQAKNIILNESGPGRSLLVQRMLAKGVKILTESKVTLVTENEIHYEKENNNYIINDADTLILAVGYRPNNSLVDTITKLNINYLQLGDASKVGNIMDAIKDSYEKTKNI